MEHLLAVTLEAKMPRLDDPGMHRADRHFVNLFTLDAEEIGDADEGRFAGLAAPSIVAGAIRRVKAHRPKPRVPFRPHAELLGNLTLEEMHLRAVWRERREAVAIQCRLADLQSRPCAVRDDGVQIHIAARRRRIAKQRHHALAGFGRGQDCFAEISEGKLRHLPARQRLAQPQNGERGLAHRFTSRNAAASRNNSSSGGGIYRPSSSTSAMNSRIGKQVLTLSRKPLGCFGSDGSPCTTASTVAPMPMKTTPSSNRKSPPLRYCPLPMAAFTMVNSLMNGPNGGEPVIARNPT